MLRTAILSTVLIAGGVMARADTVKQTTRIEIDTAIDLPAPVDAVWRVLTDIDAYPQWNPYHVHVEGVLQRGRKLTVKIVKPNGNSLTIHPRVLELEENRSLVWGGGPAGLFRGVHWFDLDPINPGCTRLHHTEVFSGLFVSYAELDAIEPGYERMNQALKARLSDVGTATGC
ncbi:SRPBCC domain-containing protein [Thalassovita sp.]|uniref:SRPBCC domain-containing protein n=1 Tax=Thalassovita sp. TaxID=1979401 RepID=UPI002B2714EB|nr:SRPBCC domain-containing protein [Thalassovita sp.]